MSNSSTDQVTAHFCRHFEAEKVKRPNLFSSKRLIRSKTLEGFSLGLSRLTAPVFPPPLPSSILLISGGFWMWPNGDGISVTGLWRCSGFGGTGYKTEEFTT